MGKSTFDNRSRYFDVWRYASIIVSESLSDTQYSNVLLGHIRNRNVPRLMSVLESISPFDVVGDQYASVLQLRAFFKRNTSFQSGDWKAEAISALLEDEAINHETNLRLRSAFFQADFAREITIMRKVVARCLGSFRSFLDTIPYGMSVTSGATAEYCRRKATRPRKIRKKLFANPKLADLVRCLGMYLHVPGLRVQSSVANRLVVVRKNYKTGRTIACEPDGNIPFQLAFDRYLRRRLCLVYGIDLNDQTINQRRALRGSVDGSLATIDFKSASNSVTRGLVDLLFDGSYDSIRFADFLYSTRSPEGILPDGQRITYEMFSSMGNASTFVLESMVFTALAISAGSRDYSVYGDDVIIETECVERFVSLAEAFGFRINVNKSFYSGSFRESCGGNYLAGVDVTPTYVQSVRPKPYLLCHYVNGFVRNVALYRRCVMSILHDARSYGLPLVPSDCPSTSGVWCSISYLTHTRLVYQDKRGRQCCNGYSATLDRNDRGRPAHNLKGYLLWLLDHRTSCGDSERDHEIQSYFDMPGLSWTFTRIVGVSGCDLPEHTLPEIVFGTPRN